MSPKTQHPHSTTHCFCFSCFPPHSLLFLLLLLLTRQRHQYVLSRGSVGQCIQMAWMQLLLLPSAWPEPWPRLPGCQAAAVAAVGSLSPPHCVGRDVKLCTLTICYIPGNGYTRLGVDNNISMQLADTRFPFPGSDCANISVQGLP